MLFHNDRFDHMEQEYIDQFRVQVLDFNNTPNPYFGGGQFADN